MKTGSIDINKFQEYIFQKGFKNAEEMRRCREFLENKFTSEEYTINYELMSHLMNMGYRARSLWLYYEVPVKFSTFRRAMAEYRSNGYKRRVIVRVGPFEGIIGNYMDMQLYYNLHVGSLEDYGSIFNAIRHRERTLNEVIKNKGIIF